MATNASYKPQFYVVPLDPAEADQAYPLVRTIAPEVSREEWLDYVERRCREGGLIGLFGDDGALIGLASHRFGQRLRHGRVLALDGEITTVEEAIEAARMLL